MQRSIEGSGKMQTIRDIASEMEHRNCNLGAARSVLSEAVNYFGAKNIEPGSFEADYPVMQQDHILNLFYAAENMLCDLEKQQKAIIDWLYGKAREERASA
jgi:hypothetical protein